jgi:hypothetical protein
VGLTLTDEQELEQLVLKKTIRKFYNLLKKYPDHTDSAYDFVIFLRSFLRLKTQEPLPTIEIMTVLEKNKPIVFYILRQMAKKNKTLGFLTELSMEYKVAEQTLQKLMETKHVKS